MTNLKTQTFALATALLFLAPAMGATSGQVLEFKPHPRDMKDTESGSGTGSAPEGEPEPDWTLAFTYTEMDTRGADFTYGTTPDPIADNITGLRDDTIQDNTTDRLLPFAQENQTGWMEGRMVVNTSEVGPDTRVDLYFLFRPQGWFPGIERDAGDRRQSDASVGWTRQAEGSMRESLQLSWAPLTAGCEGPAGTADFVELLDRGVDHNADHHSIHKGAGPGEHYDPDPNTGIDPNEFRSDQVAVGFHYSSDTACSFRLQLDFRLFFVHEVDGGTPDSADDVGYVPGELWFGACLGQLKSQETQCDLEHGGTTQKVYTVAKDVFYFPIFPLGWAMKHACPLTFDLLDCTEFSVSQRAAGSQAQLDLLYTGSEFIAISFDRSPTGLTDVQIYYLASLQFKEATGTEDQMLLL